MRVACSQCQNQVQIDDAKVPSGPFKIKCPKCGNVNTVQGPASSAPPPDAPQSDDSAQAISPEIEAFVKREIAAARREILGAIQALFGGEVKWQTEEGAGADSALLETGKKALICEDDQVFVDIVSATLRKLGYSIDVARSTSEAIKKVENGYYQLITVDYIFPDDKEGGNKIIAKINGQKPAQRRPDLRGADFGQREERRCKRGLLSRREHHGQQGGGQESGGVDSGRTTPLSADLLLIQPHSCR